MNYPGSVDFLYALGNEVKTAKLGLDRIRAVLAELGNPQDHIPLIHVAGTNGKGSTSAMIASALSTRYTTGLFTSPHLSEPTERIRIGGVPVARDEFAAAFDEVHGAVERLLERGAIDLHTTYFETVTAMALLVFSRRAECAVLEVGLGGRLDATNVVTPELCVITPIDFDHEQYLGRSIEAIAGEKAGILKPGIPAVFSAQRPEAAAVLDRRAAELGVAVARASELRVERVELHPRGSRFLVEGLRIDCPLAGEHQVQNALTAIAALRARGIPPRAIESGIAATRWPGRLERIAEAPEIVVDGAHNPAGARSLAAYLDRFYPGRAVTLVFGAMRDKAIDEIAGILFPHAAETILTAPRQARALAPEALRDAAGDPAARVAPGIAEALDFARAAGRPVFVTGSLFLVAEARAILGIAP